MKRFLLICCLLIFTKSELQAQCEVENQCTYEFKLYEAWGDSWNGNTMTVVQNEQQTVLSFPTYGPIYTSVFVNLCEGQPFQLFWNEEGLFPIEVGVTVINPFGQVIYNLAGGQNLQGEMLFSDLVNCTSEICPAPSNGVVTDLSADSITIQWTELGEATQWEVFTVPAGASAPTPSDVGMPAVTNSATITGLVDGNAYDIYIRAQCSPSSFSQWTLPLVATAICPEVIIYNTYTNHNGFTVMWLNDIPHLWEVIWQSISAPTPLPNSQGEITTHSNFSPDEVPVGDYNIYIRSVCSSSVSDWSDPVEFSVTCAEPTGITINGNQISWTPNGAANNYEVFITSANGYTHQNTVGVFTTDNPYTAPELVVGQTYNVFIRAYCTNGDIGAWTSARAFTYQLLGQQDFEKPSISIIPNPANNNVDVYSDGNIQSIDIFDILGKNVLSTLNISDERITIDVSGLANGIYTMRIRGEAENSQNKRLIISR